MRTGCLASAVTSASARRFGTFAPLLAMVLLLVSQGGCKGPCDSPPKPAEDFFGGNTYLDQGVYESVSWNGPFLEFGPQRRYRFFHGLGGEPMTQLAYLSFEPNPLPHDGLGNVSLAAGNEAIFEDPDDEYIVVRNDTCGEFYVRVVVGNPKK